MNSINSQKLALDCSVEFARMLIKEWPPERLQEDRPTLLEQFADPVEKRIAELFLENVEEINNNRPVLQKKMALHKELARSSYTDEFPNLTSEAYMIAYAREDAQMDTLFRRAIEEICLPRIKQIIESEKASSL